MKASPPSFIHSHSWGAKRHVLAAEVIQLRFRLQSSAGEQDVWIVFFPQYVSSLAEKKLMTSHCSTSHTDRPLDHSMELDLE